MLFQVENWIAKKPNNYELRAMSYELARQRPIFLPSWLSSLPASPLPSLSPFSFVLLPISYEL